MTVYTKKPTIVYDREEYLALLWATNRQLAGIVTSLNELEFESGPGGISRRSLAYLKELEAANAGLQIKLREIQTYVNETLDAQKSR